MSRRYSARDREMAARICSVRASDWGMNGLSRDQSSVLTAEHIGAGEPAVLLAWNAFLSTQVPPVKPYSEMWAQQWAEAEALIRTGWSPS